MSIRDKFVYVTTREQDQTCIGDRRESLVNIMVLYTNMVKCLLEKKKMKKTSCSFNMI